MHFIAAFVRYPVSVSVGVLLVVLFGFIALFRMPMQLTPEVEKPTITIETSWNGASPQEIEREIVQEQEEQLKSVEGMTKMSSESSDSRARITIEFLVGTDMSEALVKVNSRLQQVKEYPENADEPVITLANSDRYIAYFILSPKLPTPAEIDAVVAKHPQLAGPLARVKSAKNPALANYRLKEVAQGRPEVAALLRKDIDATKLRRFAEDIIESRFERVSGVSSADVQGGREEEMQVIVDPERLAARQVTIDDLRQALRAQNKDTSAGDMWEGKRRWVIRTLGQFKSVEQVEGAIVARRDGKPVYVRDVAETVLGYKKVDGFVRRYGESCIAISASRETGANVLEVMEGLRQATRELNSSTLDGRGLQLYQVYDETDYIYSAVGLVNSNIVSGGVLTMIVLMLFLHQGVKTLLFVPAVICSALAAAYLSPWLNLITLALIVGAGLWFARSALVIAVTVPISTIGTFLMMGVFGRSLNVISLAGLAFAVGMLVDNSIVVLENIFSHHQRGKSPLEAAIVGTQEVWGAVVASTLTNLAVFLPVLFIQEEAGQLFRDIALAISASVGLSLLTCISVVPCAAARLLDNRGRPIDQPPFDPLPAPTTAAVEINGTKRLSHSESGLPAPLDATNGHSHGELNGHRALPEPTSLAIAKDRKKLAGAIVATFVTFGAWFVNAVLGVNRWVLATVPRQLACVAIMIGGSLFVSWLTMPKVEYLPSGNRNLAIGMLMPPPGYNMQEMQDMGDIVEQRLKKYWDVDVGSPEADALDAPAIDDFFVMTRGRQTMLGMRAADPLQAAGLIPLIRDASADLPGTDVMVRQSSLFERGSSAGRMVDVEITGPDLEKLVRLGIEVRDRCRAEIGVKNDKGELIIPSQVIARPSLELASPEVHLLPKWDQAADMMVNADVLGYTVDALVDGAYASDYYLGGDKIDLTIKGRDEFATHTQDVAALPVATPSGQLVPLAALATIEYSSGPEQINRRERQRAITIQVSPPVELPLEDAINAINDKVVQPLRDRGELEGGCQITLAGTADKLRATWNALWFNLLLATLITYLLMAALFESWLYPLVIILSVPLGAVGGIAGLALLNLFLLQPLDVLTMLGFVILVGTVVNNPILIVHQAINHMREDGMAPKEAILESTRTRIRPIFMTAVTTLVGLFPLVVMPGAGSELYRGLGCVLLGGLSISTIFTLVLVPALFSLTLSAKASLVRAIQGAAKIVPVPIATLQPAAAGPREISVH